MSFLLHAISRVDKTEWETHSDTSSSSPLYIITSQSLNKESFSIHLSCSELKFF